MENPSESTPVMLPVTGTLISPPVYPTLIDYIVAERFGEVFSAGITADFSSHTL